MTLRERFLFEHICLGHSADELVAAFNRRFSETISRNECLVFEAHVRRLGLHPESADVPMESYATEDLSRSAANPAPKGLNGFFDLLVAAFGWLIHPLATVPLVLLFCAASVALAHSWDAYVESLMSIRHGVSYLVTIAWMIATGAVCVFLPRAIMLGIACRKFGGRIYSVGIRLERGIFPFFQCNTGDSFGRMSYSRQWVLLTVGLWTHGAILSLAVSAFAALNADNAFRVFLTYLIFSATVSLLLQGIIFFPRDGYRMLCFLLRKPHLRERALSETFAWVTARVSPEPVSRKEAFWLRVFGVGTIVARIFSYGLIIGGGSYLIGTREGPGGILAFALLVSWWMYPFVERTVMALLPKNWTARYGGSSLLRWTVRLTIVLLIVLAGFVPYTYDVVGECRLLAESQLGIRAQINGEIVAVHVREGQVVQSGDEVITISDREVSSQVDAVIADLAKANANLDLLRAGPRPEELEIARQRLELAQVRADFLGREFTRVQELQKKDAATDRQLESAEQEHESAQRLLALTEENLGIVQQGARVEQIAAAEAEVRRLEARRDFTETQARLIRVSSPITGTISTPHISQRLGQVVTEGDLIAVVQDVSTLVVEIAANDTAAALVEPDMDVQVRLFSLDGHPLAGEVRRVSTDVEAASEVLADPVRSDRESFIQSNSSRRGLPKQRIRVYATLNAGEETLRPGMTGYARIAVHNDFFWRVLFRRIGRFFRTEVWSWLP